MHVLVSIVKLEVFTVLWGSCTARASHADLPPRAAGPHHQ